MAISIAVFIFPSLLQPLDIGRNNNKTQTTREWIISPFAFFNLLYAAHQGLQMAKRVFHLNRALISLIPILQQATANQIAIQPLSTRKTTAHKRWNLVSATSHIWNGATFTHVHKITESAASTV